MFTVEDRLRLDGDGHAWLTLRHLVFVRQQLALVYLKRVRNPEVGCSEQRALSCQHANVFRWEFLARTHE